MSQFFVCDWCGEPVDNPVSVRMCGGEPFRSGALGHYHSEPNCLGLMIRSVHAAQDENRMADVPGGEDR